MIQKLTLKREIVANTGILGKIRSDDGLLVCCTFECPWLNNVKYESCILFGTYEVRPYSSSKYPSAFEIIGEVDRADVLIHNGNYIRNTQGCILVGKDWAIMDQQLSVTSSKTTLHNLCEDYKNGFLLEILPFA